VTVGIAFWAYATDRPWQSMAFALGATQLAVALGSAPAPAPAPTRCCSWRWPPRLGLQFAGLYLPVLNDLLGTQPVPIGDLLVICALSTLGYAAIRVDRIVHKGRAETASTAS
jgi:Ca2+-transporting ATPase